MREYEERKGMEMVLEGCEGEALSSCLSARSPPQMGSREKPIQWRGDI